MLVAYTNQLNTDMIQLAICCFFDFWKGGIFIRNLLHWWKSAWRFCAKFLMISVCVMCYITWLYWLYKPNLISTSPSPKSKWCFFLILATCFNLDMCASSNDSVEKNTFFVVQMGTIPLVLQKNPSNLVAIIPSRPGCSRKVMSQIKSPWTMEWTSWDWKEWRHLGLAKWVWTFYKNSIYH